MTRSLTLALLILIALHLGVSAWRIIGVAFLVTFLEFAFLVLAAMWEKKP